MNVREDLEKGVYIEGLKEEVILSYKDMINLIVEEYLCEIVKCDTCLVKFNSKYISMFTCNYCDLQFCEYCDCDLQPKIIKCPNKRCEALLEKIKVFKETFYSSKRETERFK